MTKSEMIIYEERRDDDTHPSLGKPFRVQAKLRNNRLINARRMMGFETITAASHAMGIQVTTLCNLEGFRDSPWNKRDGTWNKTAIRIAEFYRQLPEDLWPEIVAQVEQTYTELEVGAASLALVANESDPIELLESRERVQQLQAGMKLLTPRQQTVIRSRFGLDDGDEHTLDETGSMIGVTRTRAQQLEHGALRKLRRHLERRKDDFT